MPQDLTRLLEEWPFEPGKLNVRKIVGSDGEPRIQVRVELGILEMRTEGRPDGQRPNGYDSLLESFEDRRDELAANSSGERFRLNPDECQALREEGVQYYHRYMALLALEEYEGVARDATRNLRLLDFCARYAETEQDRRALEQYRAFITMIRVRALASQAVKDNEPKAALHAIEEGLAVLKQYFSDQGQPEAFDQSGEVRHLKGMRDALVPKLPVSQKTELKSRLEAAVKSENYELAAILRDELRLLEERTTGES